jgi:hypothetical protein
MKQKGRNQQLVPCFELSVIFAGTWYSIICTVTGRFLKLKRGG